MKLEVAASDCICIYCDAVCFYDVARAVDGYKIRWRLSIHVRTVYRSYRTPTIARRQALTSFTFSVVYFIPRSVAVPKSFS
jgi:hypothetical protein